MFLFKIRFLVVVLVVACMPYVTGVSAECVNSYEASSPKKVTVMGTGYVGLVLGAGLAQLGHEVICADVIKEKIACLQAGEIPIYEAGLKEVVQKNVSEGRLSFSTNLAESIRISDIIFIAVGTPTREDGGADLSYVESVASEIGKNLNSYKLICLKSTVPIGTTEKVREIIFQESGGNIPFDVAFNPEFLRQGSAVFDFFHPDRIIVGVENQVSQKLMEELYEGLILENAPFLKMNIASAEAVKYAANAFLAVKISFINEFANLCDETGVDVLSVAQGMGLDKRIGFDFLNPGRGYGGSCFPKDTLALLHTAGTVGTELKVIQAAVEANEFQKEKMVQKLCHFLGEDLSGKTIAILGLAFKANTDDVRCSPSIDIIKKIQERGGRVKAYDPIAMNNMQKALPMIKYCTTLYNTVEDTDAVMVLTEWSEFKQMDLDTVFSLMKKPVLIDAQNSLDPNKLRAIGFHYDDVGRLKK